VTIVQTSRSLRFEHDVVGSKWGSADWPEPDNPSNLNYCRTKSPHFYCNIIRANPWMIEFSLSAGNALFPCFHTALPSLLSPRRSVGSHLAGPR